MTKTVKLRMLASTPLRPLAQKARTLSASALSLEVASGFVSEDALRDILGPAIDGGANVRVLTGTFGRVTRLKTFVYLQRLAVKQTASVRIWSCGTHEDFHAKLFIWRLRDRRVVVWIGSANLTSGGLVNEGELVCQIEGTEHAVRSFTSAFEREWRRGEDLDEAFISSYKEAPRTGGFTRRRSTPTRGGTRRVPAAKVRMYVTVGNHHYKDDGPVDRRVAELLEGTAWGWFRDAAKSARQVRIGDLFLYDDRVDKDMGADPPRRREFV
jgi:HKD family nuclease